MRDQRQNVGTSFLLKFGAMVLFALVRLANATDLTSGWNDWMSKGRAYREAGNYPEAIEAFRHALAASEVSSVSDSRLAETHNLLALAYSETRQIAEAGHDYQLARNLVERVEGRDCLDYAILSGRLALLISEEAESEKAASLLRSGILNHRIASFEQRLLARSILVQILLKQRLYQEAGQTLSDMRADLAKTKEPDRQLLAEVLTESAFLSFNKGHYIMTKQQTLIWSPYAYRK